MIDVHVHLRDGSQAHKETIYHGISVGTMCGITSFFDMPNTDIPLTTNSAIQARLESGSLIASVIGQQRNERLFYGIYGGVTSEEEQLTSVVASYHTLFPAMVGLKMFAGHSTGSMGIIDLPTQQKVYETLTRLRYRGILAVHCEKESLLCPSLYNSNRPESHCDARPKHAEIVSIEDQIACVKHSGFLGTLHICHVSCEESLKLIEQARKEGLSISCGATPHHALLDRSVAHKPGNVLKMNPPLREERDRKAIFQGLMTGIVDWIESDHAPHTLDDKASGASGVPGFAGYVLLVKALRKAHIHESQLKKVCGERACERFGIELPVDIPTDEAFDQVLPSARLAYPWDPFETLS